ncbi:MAG: hypothetical protein RL289_868 [Actinomycetota bacterium]
MFERLVMSRNYGASSKSLAHVSTDTDGAPNWFSWRGRRYVVLAILFSWLEAAPWWRTRQTREWQVWRIEATDQTTQTNSGARDMNTPYSGARDMNTPYSGVYDIATSDQRWFIRRVMD